MNNVNADYLSSLEFPSLITENSNEECFNMFREEYNFILQSLLPKLPPLLETPGENQYLLVALLKTLAERESLLQRDINQLLYLLLPSPKAAEKHLALKSTYLDEVIALFGMKRESSISLTPTLTASIPESDVDIKVRLTSRLGILNNAGTESYYKHHFLSLSPTIQDVLIEVEPGNNGELVIYLLAKMPRPKVSADWIKDIEIALENKDIFTVADSYKLAAAKFCYYQFKPELKNNLNKKDFIKIDNLINDYAVKKYRFNSIISRTEFYSYLEDTSLEKLDIKLYQCSEKGKREKEVEKIECLLGEVPCLVENNDPNENTSRELRE